MTFLETLQAHKGGLIRLKAEGHGSHADVRDDDASAAEAVAFHKSRMLAGDGGEPRAKSEEGFRHESAAV